jgi:hypothetical protein
MPNAVKSYGEQQSRRQTTRQYKVTVTAGTYARNANGAGGETINLTTASLPTPTGNIIGGLFDPSYVTQGKYILKCTREFTGYTTVFNWNPTATSWANAIQMMLLETSAVNAEATEIATGTAYSAQDLADFAILELVAPSRMTG